MKPRVARRGRLRKMADYTPEKAGQRGSATNLVSASIARPSEVETKPENRIENSPGQEEPLHPLDLKLPKKPELSRSKSRVSELAPSRHIETRKTTRTLSTLDVFSRTLRWLADVLRKLDRKIFTRQNERSLDTPLAMQTVRRKKKNEKGEEQEEAKSFERPQTAEDDQPKLEEDGGPWREPPKKIRFDDD